MVRRATSFANRNEPSGAGRSAARDIREKPRPSAGGYPPDSAFYPAKLIGRPGFDLEQTPFVASEGIELIKTSDGLGWPSLFVALSEEKPHEGWQGAAPDLWITMTLERTDVRRIIAGRDEHMVMEPYRISIAGPGMSVEVHLGNEARALHVFLRDHLIEEVARELFDQDAGRAEIISAFGIEDLTTGWLLRSAKQSLLGPAQHSSLRPNTSRAPWRRKC